MELSHRDQTESSVAGGFLPANTHHPLTNCTLYLFTSLQEGMSSLLLRCYRGRAWRPQYREYLSACLSYCLLVVFLLCVLMQEGQSVAYAFAETEF